MDISPLAAGAAERRAGVQPDGGLRAGLLKMSICAVGDHCETKTLKFAGLLMSID